jgi:hypothetical protein
VNDTGKQSASLKDLEVRYHYRFITNFPFHLARELQTTLFAGYETYKNTSTITASYDLLKFGTSLEFPVSNKWGMGGEFGYGLGSDSSSKLEISGNVNYYFQSAWSLGVGYRVNLFTAGSTKATPTGVLPYREGYTEGFSTLNYHY